MRSSFSRTPARSAKANQRAVVVVQRRRRHEPESLRRGTTPPATSPARAGPRIAWRNPALLALLPGQVTSVFTVPILDNFAVDGARSIKLTLSDPSGGARCWLGAPRPQLQHPRRRMARSGRSLILSKSGERQCGQRSGRSAGGQDCSRRRLQDSWAIRSGSPWRARIPTVRAITAFKEAANVNGRLAVVSALVVAPDGRVGPRRHRLLIHSKINSESVLRLECRWGLGCRRSSPQQPAWVM